MTKQKKSRFFNLEPLEESNYDCKDRGHNPPSHLYIPQGKGYIHVCPKCGKETIIKAIQVSF